MLTFVQRWCVSLLAVLLVVPTSSCNGVEDDDPAPDSSTADVSLFVYSRTDGYRHEAIPDGIDALRSLSDERGWSLEATEDSAAFRPDRLADIDVVVFLNTTEDVLGPNGQEALRTFVEEGGGFVGIHAAADTEYDWPWYGRLVGAYFKGHPEIQEATVHVEDGSHPSTRMLSDEWVRRDEWYNYRSNPRDSVQVLLTLDESTYDGGTMGDDHPIAWYHSVGDGRSWYTGMGHTSESYADPTFREHLAGGIHWAAGLADAPSADQ